MSAPNEDTKEEGRDALVGRELASSVNTEQLLQEHAKRVNGKVRTRFPPEPNGYLHIGHAKSMNMNFELAFEKLGVPVENRQTIFRYDDTNPDAESEEYIESLRADVEWLGWKPVQTTFTSNYFTELHELAVKLIKLDKAYVCHQSKAEMEASREIAKCKLADPNFEGNPNSPFRDRPIEESLREFENMRKGKYAASEAILRMKMDMTSPNPNMWDQVAYRIKYTAHPHAGSDWCIYPTYDYTHCIIDSMEDVDYSICTLEFETRRESYFWVLEALDLYRPKVYEMSRLNLSYTVLSKRKLIKLVNNGYMRGWDDPRMPTIRGLRRRGYTPDIINAFCKDIGATRNANTVQYERIEAIARNQLHETAPRVMVVMKPLRVKLVNLDAIFTEATVSVPDFPFDVSRGSHLVPVEEEMFIDAADFRMEDDKDYFGLAPGKVVMLKYLGRIICESVRIGEDGAPLSVWCRCLGEDDENKTKPKGTIQWVPASTAVSIECRLYDKLFTVEEPTDAGWEKELNPKSEEVRVALADPSLLSHKLDYGYTMQFERLGFFVVDKESKSCSDGDKLVLNLTVGLKDSKPKDESVTGATKSRKEQQDKQMADKLARLSVAPQDLFKTQTDLYSQFDADGVPTHDNTGEKLSKSAAKKLQKEWEKQKKIYDDHIKATGS